MTDYTPNSPSYYGQQSAAALQGTLGNMAAANQYQQQMLLQKALQDSDWGALAQIVQGQQGSGGPTPPMPGQPSAPSPQNQPGGMGGYPPITPVQGPQQLPPPGAPQGVSRIPPVNASQLQPPPQGPGPNISPMAPPPMPPSPAQMQPQQQGNPGMGGLQSLVQSMPNPASLASAVQRANPNMPPAELSALIQAVIPMFQAKAAAMSPYQQFEMQKWGDQKSIEEERNKRLRENLDLSKSKADLGYIGDKARTQTGGRIAEASAIAETAIEKQIPKAAELYSQLSRSKTLALGKIQNILGEQTNDPTLSKLKPILEGIAREYARAMGGTGTIAQGNLQHARDLLGTSKDQEAFEAAMDGLKFDIQTNREAAAENVPTGGGMPSSGIKLPGKGASEDGWGEMKVQ